MTTKTAQLEITEDPKKKGPQTYRTQIAITDKEEKKKPVKYEAKE